MVSASEGIFTVAPHATHRTTRQTHKRAGTSGVCRLALNRTKNFGNSQHEERFAAAETKLPSSNLWQAWNLAQRRMRVKVSPRRVKSGGNWAARYIQLFARATSRQRDSIMVRNLLRESPVSELTERNDNLFTEGARRLLERATDSYSLTVEALSPRIGATVAKYILHDEPNASSAVIVEFIDQLQSDDLCVILACEQGHQKAWDDLVARFSATVRSAARSASQSEEGAEDLAQSIWAELHGLRLRADGKLAGKLAYYSGRGSLAGWLRAVVAQLAVDQHRKQSRMVQTEEDADFDRILQRGSEEQSWSGHGAVVNPELAVSQKLAGAELKQALGRAIKQLSAEDRLLVKLYYFDGLRLREAGAVLGVHEATASRRLTRVHADLRQHVERILVDEGGWSKAETERAFSEVALHLEADIEPLLASESLLMSNENEIAG